MIAYRYPRRIGTPKLQPVFWFEDNGYSRRSKPRWPAMKSTRYRTTWLKSTKQWYEGWTAGERINDVTQARRYRGNRKAKA